MNGLASIINTIANAISIKVMAMLSRQIAESGRGQDSRPHGILETLIHKLTGIPVHHRSYSDRLDNPASPSHVKKYVRSKSRLDAAQSNFSKAKSAYDEAVKSIEEMSTNPQGKDSGQLLENAEKYAKELSKAAKVLEKVTKAHEQLGEEIKQATRGNVKAGSSSPWANPREFFGKIGQRFRVAGKRLARIGPARQAAADARRTLERERANHEKSMRKYSISRQGFRNAMKAYKNARLGGNDSRIGFTRNLAKQYFGVMRESGQAVTQSGRALAAAGAASKAADALAATRTAQGIMAVGAAGGPFVEAVAAAATVATTALVAMKTLVRRSEELIEGKIRQYSEYSGQVNTALNRYDVQTGRLKRNTAQTTADSASDLIHSQMALRETMQPRQAAWEEIGNRVQTDINIVAKLAQEIVNKIDVVTPAVQAYIAYAESVWSMLIPGFQELLQEIKDKNKGANIGAQVMQSINSANRFGTDKSFPDVPKPFPAIKKVK